MNRFSLNSWTLHESLGPSNRARVSADGSQVESYVEPQPQSLSLTELPALLAEQGVGAVDICYFHFPRHDREYLDELREALTGAGVELFCRLIDFGNMSQTDSAARETELAWIGEWIRRAGYLGARCARAVAGEGHPDDPAALRQAVDGYKRLADIAGDAGVRLLTENLGGFARNADPLLRLLERLDGRVGLCVDYGNGRAVGEYDQLRRMVPHAESVHAKPEVKPDGSLEAEDFQTCVEETAKAGFKGPYTIVYRGPKAPWEGILETKELIAGAMQANASP